MAANAVIGSLRVNLGMDSAEFESGAKRAQSTLGGLGASIKAFAAGAVAALSLGAVTAALKSSVDHMDELGKAAQKIGIPVEQLSGLEYAARLADVSLEGLSSNLSKFNRSLGEIAGGGKNDAGAALKAIGVAALDANGKLRPTAAIVADVAEKFAGYKDGAEKSALAMAIFGKAGADMIPLLNGGREAITGATEEAARFGLIVSEDAAKAAEQFNDNLTRMKAAGEGLTNQVAQAMLPAMVDVTNAMVRFAEKGVIAEQVANALSYIMQEVARFVVEASAAFEEITLWVNAAGESFDALTSGDFSGAAGAWSNASEKVAKTWEDAAQRIKEIYGTVQHSNAVLKGDLPTGEKGAAPTLPPSTTTKPGKGKTTDDVKAATKSLYDMDLGLQRVKASAQETSNAFGDAVSNGIGSWIDSAVDGTFKLKDALKDLAKDLAKLALNKLFQNLLGGGGGHALYGGGGAGIGSLFGFARGGTIMPGGTGGIDSQLVAFRKSPNERVDITKPGQTLHSGGDAKIIINNNAGVDVRPSRGRDGSFRFDINKAVADTLSSGGADGSMAARFGVPPSRVRR